MKNKTALLALLAVLQMASVPLANAQRGFDIKGMVLMDGRKPGKATFDVNGSRAAAVRALGKPTKIEKQYDEIDNDTAVVYYYRTNKLYFLKDQLLDFVLNDNTLAFGRSYEQAFRVGALLTSAPAQRKAGAPAASKRHFLNKLPPTDLHVDTEPGKSRNIPYAAMAYNNTRYGATETDAHFEILFDAKNRVIQIAMPDYD